jgi:hypothetical protein
MASKWEGLKGKFSKTPVGKMSEFGSDSSFVTKVNAEKDRLRDLHSGSQNGYFIEMKEAEERKEELNDEIKTLNVRLEALSQLILAQFEAADVSLVKSDIGRTFSIGIEPYPAIINKETFEQFVDERPELQYLWSINASSFKAWVKDKLEQGRDAEIPECVSVFLKSVVKCTKTR